MTGKTTGEGVAALLKPFHIILTADVHLQCDTPRDLDLGMQELKDYATIAAARGIRYVCVAGDMLHFRHRFPQDLLVALYTTLERLKATLGVTFIIIRGNHDSASYDTPEDTILTLFDKVAIIVNTPMLIEEEDCVVLMMPWYLPHEFRPLLQHFASFALGYSKPRILISHVSIQEGKVAPSNVRVTTPIRRSDLLPDVWTGGIFLGDYHAHQCFGGPREVYLGAARARTFGDFNNVGVWEVTPSVSRVVPLPSKYPMFKSWRVDGLADLPLSGYDEFDHNRCYCPDKLKQYVAQQYPAMSLLPNETVPQGVEGRLQVTGVMSTVDVAKKWAKMKQLTPDYTAEMVRYLK
jgi:DNA repair exonuclease SbcCD nuclease subunit